MPSQYVMQSQVVANFATSVVSDSLSPLDFMLTGEEARIRQAKLIRAKRISGSFHCSFVPSTRADVLHFRNLRCRNRLGERNSTKDEIGIRPLFERLRGDRLVRSWR
jgi:hypothetical protein